MEQRKFYEIVKKNGDKPEEEDAYLMRWGEEFCSNTERKKVITFRLKD